DRFGALGGAEVNIQINANELKKNGHRLALLHGPGTGKNAAAWGQTFSERFALDDDGKVHRAVQNFAPDLIYAHKLDNLDALQALLDCGVPVVRMVHDHQMY